MFECEDVFDHGIFRLGSILMKYEFKTRNIVRIVIILSRIKFFFVLQQTTSNTL